MREARETRPATAAPPLLSLIHGGLSAGLSGTTRPRGSVESNDSNEGERGGDTLLATIESAIIPRLLLLHRTAGAFADGKPSRMPPTDEEVRAFAEVCATRDLGAALGFVERLCRQGLSIEMVLLELVAEAARLLGGAWERDERSFTEVTAGLGVLQQVVHALGPGFSSEAPGRGQVVLTTAPGEQHTLGLHLVGEFLRRAGWGVTMEPSCHEAILMEMVADQPVDVVGFTVSSPERLPALADLIARLRVATQNPDLVLMVGGPLDPALLAAFGDQHGVVICSTDAREAVDCLEERSLRLV